MSRKEFEALLDSAVGLNLWFGIDGFRMPMSELKDYPFPSEE